MLLNLQFSQGTNILRLKTLQHHQNKFKWRTPRCQRATLQLWHHNHSNDTKKIILLPKENNKIETSWFTSIRAYMSKWKYFIFTTYSVLWTFFYACFTHFYPFFRFVKLKRTKCCWLLLVQYKTDCYMVSTCHVNFLCRTWFSHFTVSMK